MAKYVKLDDVKAIIKEYRDRNKEEIRSYGYSYSDTSVEKLMQAACSERDLEDIEADIEDLDTAEMLEEKDLPMPPEASNE